MSGEPTTDLVRRAHALTVAGGVARSTSEIAFEGAVPLWDDLPAATRAAARHASPVVAEQAGTDAGLYRDTDRLVQVLRAWRAHRDRLYVAVAQRPFRLDGEPRPDGPWQHVSLSRYDVRGEARRRIGWVPAGTVPAPVHAPGAAAGDAGARTTPAHGPEAAGAADAWPYLPEAVRTGAQRVVPLPEDWLGHLVQHADAKRMPLSQEVVVLRRDAEAAVVIRATRELEPAPGLSPTEQGRALAAADWLVEQVVLTTTRPRQLTADRPDDPWS